MNSSILLKNNHGEVWDLCAAVARELHTKDIHPMVCIQVLRFSLSYCDEEFIDRLFFRMDGCKYGSGMSRVGSFYTNCSQ